MSLFKYTPSVPGMLSIILGAVLCSYSATGEIFDMNDSQSTKRLHNAEYAAIANSSSARCRHIYGKLTPQLMARCKYMYSYVKVL
jgi:hypothetical protein